MTMVEQGRIEKMTLRNADRGTDSLCIALVNDGKGAPTGSESPAVEIARFISDDELRQVRRREMTVTTRRKTTTSVLTLSGSSPWTVRSSISSQTQTWRDCSTSFVPSPPSLLPHH